MSVCYAFCVLNDAKWSARWRRLIPLWVGLWLMSSFGGSAVPQHLDGTPCNTCARTSFALTPDKCEPEAQRRYGVQLGANEPENCRQCCAPTHRNAPDEVISSASHAAILSASHSFTAPERRERRSVVALAALFRDALPRPPPRGRAPPGLFSLSPFCLSKTTLEHENSI